MDYDALAKQYGGSPTQQQQQDWMSDISPKDRAKLRMETISGAKKRIAEVDADIAKAEPILRYIERFGSLNRETATGSLWDAVAPASPVFRGANKQEMQAIQSRLGPSQRVEGSGASSDRDVQLFMSGIPGVDKKGNVNKNIREQFKRQYNYAVKKKSAMQSYLSKNGSLDGFDEQWADILRNEGKQPVKKGKSKMMSPKFLGFEE